MKISELIEILKEIKKEHDDIVVAVQYKSDDDYSIPDSEIYTSVKKEITVKSGESFTEIKKVDRVCVLQVFEEME